MRLLVAVASRHGSTHEIAEALAESLRACDHSVDLCWTSDVTAINQYDAVVLGSSVHMGGWVQEAQRFAARHRLDLQKVPVWLFSSGPLGKDDPQPPTDRIRIRHLREMTGARDHRVFAGRLDPGDLSVGEKAAVEATRLPEGDFRDWDAIRDWAHEIASSLRTGP